MRFGSLFSGCGGADLGLERAGLQCAWQVENDDFAIRVLEKHWPHVRRHKDIRDFRPDDSWRVPIVFGGFPCKQTSTGAAVHGKRNGLDGRDSGLWHEMLRVVQALQPEWVVVENVAGAATWGATIKGGLESAGYIVPGNPCRLSAESFGAPHRRRRLFWIADRHGKGLEVARQVESFEADSEPRRAADGNAWLSSLAGTVRVDDGVPGTLDRRKRIERIGNAVVPAMAEFIGRRIMAANQRMNVTTG